MKLAILGRTAILAKAARHLLDQGHTISVIGTCTPEDGKDELTALAQEIGCKFFVSGRAINFDPLLLQLRNQSCDIAISMNWNGMLSPGLISCFKHGILNAHAGDLPRYRGNACANWAILRGEQRIGLCIHAMVEQLDAGPVYQREYLDLTQETYIGDIYDWFADRIPIMFSEAIAMIRDGIVPTYQPSDPSLSLRCYPRRPEDSKIDWKDSAEHIHRLVRASSRPFAGAYCYTEDSRKVVIWRSAIARPADQHIGMPGQPCEPLDGDPMICCGQGFLRLLDVSIESSVNPKTEINSRIRRRLC